MSAPEIGLDLPEAPSWQCDPYGDALTNGHGPLFLRRSDGWLLPLDVEHWCGRADQADATALDHCEGSTLDVGCGPGRMVAELARRGHTALGVDVNPLAVARAESSGARAVCRSAFDPLPGEGTWHTALLVDGNVGIGGVPDRLFARMHDLVRPGGLLVAEAAREDVRERVTVRVTDGRGSTGEAFRWARLGLPALLESAGEQGWTCADTWESQGRTFTALRAGP